MSTIVVYSGTVLHRWPRSERSGTHVGKLSQRLALNVIVCLFQLLFDLFQALANELTLVFFMLQGRIGYAVTTLVHDTHRTKALHQVRERLIEHRRPPLRQTPSHNSSEMIRNRRWDDSLNENAFWSDFSLFAQRQSSHPSSITEFVDPLQSIGSQ